MSIQELTDEKHTEAQHTPFMQAALQQKLPEPVWADYVFQRFIFYTALETVARDAGIMAALPGLERALKLYQDAKDRCQGDFPSPRPETIAYSRYLLDLAGDKDAITAHVYTLHMGDLSGGQEIKQLIPGPHRSLEFDDIPGLKAKIRMQVNDSMAEESRVAYDWVIGLLRSYDNQLIDCNVAAAD